MADGSFRPLRVRDDSLREEQNMLFECDRIVAEIVGELKLNPIVKVTDGNRNKYGAVRSFTAPDQTKAVFRIADFDRWNLAQTAKASFVQHHRAPLTF